MRWGMMLFCFPLSTVLLMGADAAWRDEPLGQWDEVDAKQVRTKSPWVRVVMPQTVRDLSVYERRDGGDWDADSVLNLR